MDKASINHLAHIVEVGLDKFRGARVSLAEIISILKRCQCRVLELFDSLPKEALHGGCHRFTVVQMLSQLVIIERVLNGRVSCNVDSRSREQTVTVGTSNNVRVISTRSARLVTILTATRIHRQWNSTSRKASKSSHRETLSKKPLRACCSMLLEQ